MKAWEKACKNNIDWNPSNCVIDYGHIQIDIKKYKQAKRDLDRAAIETILLGTET